MNPEKMLLRREVMSMDDKAIIELYFARNEQAIEETRLKYGRLINSVAFDILRLSEDTEECENDTYFRTWRSIPPTIPTFFSAFLCKIARNLAINRLREGKRNLNMWSDVIFDEIANSLPSTEGDITDDIVLRDALNDFLESLGKTKRLIFMKRYFYMREIKVIAKETGVSVASVKTTLFRLRAELREFIESRGIVI